jgi:hypothetical protein
MVTALNLNNLVQWPLPLELSSLESSTDDVSQAIFCCINLVMGVTLLCISQCSVSLNYESIFNPWWEYSYQSGMEIS